MGGLLPLVQRRGEWAGPQPSQVPPAVPNVTAHTPTASVPIIVLLCSGSLLFGFSTPIKGCMFNMFKTGYSDIVSQCQEFFNFSEVSELIFRRKRKFNKRFTITENLLCYTVKSKFQTVDERCRLHVGYAYVVCQRLFGPY